MRHASNAGANPFALFVDPQAVLQAVDASERLSRLKRHICHPLDKPLLSRQLDPSLAAYDEMIEDDFALDS